MDETQLKLNQQTTIIDTKHKEEEKPKQDPLLKDIKKLDTISLDDQLTDQIRNQIKLNTDQVPPENITMATGEKVKDSIYDRNTDGVFLPLNGQELLQQEPSDFADVELQNTPEMQLKAAMSDVKTDTKLFGDSEEMKIIKDEIRRLEGMGDDTPPLDMVVQYDRMIMSIQRYLNKKESSISLYGSRHRKVRSLLDQITSARQRLLTNDKNLGQGALSKRSKDAYGERLSDPKIKQIAKVQKVFYLDKGIPADATQFEKDKENIITLYKTQIDHYKGIAGSFCIREAAKKRRTEAVHMVEQLTAEMDKIASSTIDSTKSAKGAMTWGDLFNSEYDIETYEVDSEYIKNYKSEGTSTDAYRMLTNFVGGEDLFILGNEKIRFKHTDQNGEETTVEDYMKVEKRGKTLSEALEQAKKMDLPLMYADEVLRQLQTIQIIDFILGQTNRNDNSFEVTFDVQNVENVDYLVITDIKVRDHYDCLGTGTPEEMNRENKGQSTREIYDEKTDEMYFSDYDPKVADKIIGLDEKVMGDHLRSMGVPEPNIEAAQKRLSGLRRALDRDKKVGMRAKLERHWNDAIKEGGYQIDYHMFQKRNINRESAKHTYIAEELIQDSGSTDLLETKEINRNVDEESEGVKRINKKRERIRSHIKKDLGLDNKDDALSPRAQKAVRLVQRFADIAFNNVQTVKAEDYPMIFLVKKYDRKRFDDIVEKGKKKYGISVFHSIDESDKDIDLRSLFEPDNVEVEVGEKKKTPEQEREERERKDAKLKREMDRKADEKKLVKYAQDLITKKEGSKMQYWMHESAKSRKEAIDFLKKTISDLQKKDKKTPQDEKDIERLKFYLDEINTKVSGDLKYEQKDVKRVKDADFGDGRFINEKNTPLFIEEPSIRDVCQGGVGDCYFIAALAAVVEKDSSFIKKHMKDNGNGTVTVKLYKPGMIYGYNPVLVTVDKTSCMKKTGEAGAKGSLWVQMYEKAFVASGFKGFLFKKRKYEDISGGHIGEAMGYITGQKTETVFDYFRTSAGSNESLEKGMKEIDEKTGKTVYTPAFEERVAEVTEKLKKHVGRGDVITASSYTKLEGASSEGSSGEGVRRAIAGKHAYTITNMEVIEGKYYVHIRNPWGRSVAETVKNNLTGKNVIRESEDTRRSATFLMEIHDFVEHIREVQVVDSKRFYNAGH